LIDACIEASLYANYFLHFAGAWHESEMWKEGESFTGARAQLLESYTTYRSAPVTGTPRGFIKPQ
jgi:hypothetical protein